MAREPELSIKVKVDPQINKAKLEEDVRAQVSNIKKLPAVPITPDVSNLQDEIEKGLGGPYSVDIEPNLKKNLTQQINDEITAAQNGAQQIKVKLDVKEFGNDLSKQLKEQLRGVNRTLSNYLKEMQTNLALANKATYGLFGGGNRDVTIDSIFNEISKKDIKSAKILSDQLKSIYSEMPNLKKLGKLGDGSDIDSIEKMSSSLIGLSHALDGIWDSVGNEDQDAYKKALSEFNSYYKSVASSIKQISKLTEDSKFLKSLGIDKKNLLKGFTETVSTGLEDISDLQRAPENVIQFDISKYNNFDDIDDLENYASDFVRYNDQIITSAQKTKKELAAAGESKQESIGAGVPIDPSILDANTKKIIQSIGDVSAAMDDLESKSKNFSDNLTIEVDKHVGNIEEKVKQLKALVDVLPNGQKNIPADSKGQEDSKDGAAGVEEGLSSVSIQGKVVITDADVSVDVKDPVQIPGIVVVNSDAVQFGNTEELQKNVDSITSAKKALQSIVNKTDSYASEIAELGPAFQYVAQEVDNLSHSLENQIADFTRISELTNNYLDKSGSIKIDTSTVAVTGEPAAIDGKVILSADDVVTPETPVDIKGHVTLEAADITPPKTPVEVKGKIVTTTTDTETKGKKKKSQDDIEKPELIELKGHIKLENKDIERPDPIVMNGKVTVTKDNIKLPEGGIDVKGNLILKNAEIANAIRDASEKASNPKDTTKTASTNRKSSTSRRGLISDLTTVNKKIAETKNMLSDVSEDEVGTIQKRLENLRANRDEIVKLLNDTNTDNDKWYVDRKFRYANKEVDYTRLRHADSKSVKESQENIQAAQDERDKYNNEKLSAYRAYRNEQNTYKLKKARLGEDENSDEAIAVKNAIDKLDEKKNATLNSMKLTIQEYTDLMDQMGKEDAEVEEKVDRQISIIKAHESNKNKVAQTTRGKKITDQLTEAQKTYGTVEEANAANKTPTAIQEALHVQQQLVDEIAKATAGTEEYNNAVKAAEDHQKNVTLAINSSKKAESALTSAVDAIRKRFALLKEEVSQSSNDELKGEIAKIEKQAAELASKNPAEYENYASDLLALKQNTYSVQAKHTMWRKGYKGLEKKGNKIAQGVEVARQMQQDGSLKNVDFKNIDELIAKLNKLPAQTDEYAKTLEEIVPLWEEIKTKVDAVNDAENKAIKQASARIAGASAVNKAMDSNQSLIGKVKSNNGTDKNFYSQLKEKQDKLSNLLTSVEGETDPVQAAKTQATSNLTKTAASNINSITDALNALNNEYSEATQEAKKFNAATSQERSFNKASTEVANLKSMIHDYLDANKKLQGTDTGKGFYELLNALNSSDAPARIGELKKRYAELRAESKQLGLETETLVDKFEKLFGQHLSTMITMAALHKMQDALRIVYQNVVEIDTAVTELRKVSEYAGKSLEEYMSRASEQAQKLGVSISDYINSTADWKRLGYSDEDAENMATYSTLLKNVGDGIDDVNTSSSYLISTMQGFGLLADQAEDVVNKIDAVANTQPVTAKDLGEILTRSSAAMSAANNTLEETIALGTAANAVIQDADTVGTTLKSLSMYLRAAKSDAENAGIEVDGMANSVSELRSELKSLTGVDIMLDSKNFKSTYQIMKELSQVWSGLSDVTQANVTEMIGGKRNANAVSAILNNFDVAESSMESAANSANVAWAENEKYLDSIQGRLAQLDASFQALSTDVLDSGLVKTVVSLATGLTKAADAMIKFTGAIPMGAGIATFITQLGKPKMTGFTIVPSNTPGGDTEQACCAYYIKCCSAREYLVKPTNMAA